MQLRRCGTDELELEHHEADAREMLVTVAEIHALEESLPRQLMSLSPLWRPSLICCLGFGLGHVFEKMYRQVRPSHKKFIVVIEPDARRFAAALVRRAWSEAFSSRQIFWAIGEAWAQEIEQAVEEENLFSLNGVEVIYGRSFEHSPFPAQVKQVVERAMGRGRAGLQREVAAAQAYYDHKRPDDLHRVLAMEIREGMAVRYIQQRFLDECARLGMEVHWFTHPPLGGMALLREVARLRPDWLLFMNWHPAEYAPIQVLNQLRLPRVTWCIDDPYSFLKDRHAFYAQDFIWTWDTGYEDCFRRRRALSVDHVPYLADLDGVEAAPQDRFQSPVSYVGQVGVLDSHRLGLSEAEAALARRVGEEKARQLHRSYQSIVLECQREYGLELIHNENDELPPHLRYGMYVAGNARRRIQVLERVRRFGLKLYGNREWLEVLGDHPLRDCYQGPADPRADVPSIFISSTVNLNIHSIQALASLNQRDFNCPLVGGFLLSDWVEQADRYFEPGREMIFYHDLDELEKHVEHYRTHPEDRDEVIHRGQARVMRDHTYAVHVPRVLDRLRERIRERYGE